MPSARRFLPGRRHRSGRRGWNGRRRLADTRNHNPAANQTGNQDISSPLLAAGAAGAGERSGLNRNNSSASATRSRQRLGAACHPTPGCEQGDDDWFRVKTAAKGDLQVSVIGLLPGQSFVLELLWQ